MFSATRFRDIHDVGRRGLHRAAATALVLAALAACHGADRTKATGGFSLTDDAGVVVHLAAPAHRVISLIPSATETLIALGATPAIVGRTRYDVAPEVASVPSVGGGIDPSVESIVALHPDLVIAWDNDKRRDVVDKLANIGIPVFTLRTEDTSDVFRGIGNLGRLTGHDSAARAIVAGMHTQLDSVHRSVAGRPTPSTLFVVYPDPPMIAGPNTFVSQLIELAGGRPAFADAGGLWPTVAMEEIVRRNPDVIILPAGEFTANNLAQLRSRPGWSALSAVRNGRVAVVPADLVNRPGPNIASAAKTIRDALHPEVAHQP